MQHQNNIENNKSIPKAIHKIWLGSTLPKEPVDLKKVLAEESERFGGDFDFNLWIDKSVLNEDQYRDFEQYCTLNNIKLRDASEIKAFKNKEFYQKELAHGQTNGKVTRNAGYVSASDILRYEILYQEGGVYSDVGDYFGESFKLDFAQMNSDPNKAYFNNLPMSRGFSNNYIIAAPRNEFLGIVINNVNKKYSNLTEKLWQAHWSKEGDIEGSIFELTGPDLIQRLGLSNRDKCKFAVGTPLDSGITRAYPSNDNLMMAREELYGKLINFINDNELSELQDYLHEEGEKDITSSYSGGINNFKAIKFITNLQEIIDNSKNAELMKLFSKSNLDLLNEDSVQKTLASKFPKLTNTAKEALNDAIKQQKLEKENNINVNQSYDSNILNDNNVVNDNNNNNNNNNVVNDNNNNNVVNSNNNNNNVVNENYNNQIAAMNTIPTQKKGEDVIHALKQEIKQLLDDYLSTKKNIFTTKQHAKELEGLIKNVTQSIDSNKGNEISSSIRLLQNKFNEQYHKWIKNQTPSTKISSLFSHREKDLSMNGFVKFLNKESEINKHHSTRLIGLMIKDLHERYPNNKQIDDKEKAFYDSISKLETSTKVKVQLPS